MVGPYKLLQQIGEGGMGTVWMAEQREPLRRTVALKIIKPGMDSGQVLARFEAERQALALMDHPNIAKVLDAGSTPKGRPYFVMELVKGIPLTRFCDEHSLPIGERLKLFVSVCQAIQHAHQKGIIHRDIKPSNVLVALHDDRPVPKVIDFGIAKAMGLRLTERTLFTEFGVLVGTLQYMSPEQAQLNQLDIDARSDIYSLGVLLYELLTGTTPLTPQAMRHAAVDELLRCIREDEALRPSRRITEQVLAADGSGRTAQCPSPVNVRAQPLLTKELIALLRRDLDWVVMMALEKDRQRRYQTANEMAADLQRYLDGEPVVARPPSISYRFGKFARRHRTAVAAVGTVALLMLVAIGVSVRAQKETDRQRLLSEKLLGNMEIREAEGLFNQGDAPGAVAHLAHILRRDPAHRVAAFRLMSALTHRHFTLPLADPVPTWLRVERPSDARIPQIHFPFACVSRDGRRWLIVSNDAARVLDSFSGKMLACVNHGQPLTSSDFSPDSLRLLTVSENTAKVWNIEGGELLFEVPQSEKITSARFTSDGRSLLIITRELTSIVDGMTGQSRIRRSLTRSNEARSCAFSPDGAQLVTASDERIHISEMTSGTSIAEIRHPAWRTNHVDLATFSPDGRWLLIVCGFHCADLLRDSAGGTNRLSRLAWIWDAWNTNLMSQPIEIPIGINNITFASNSQSFAVASSPGEFTCSLDPPAAQVGPVAYGGTAGWYRTPGPTMDGMIWSLAAGQLLVSGHTGLVTSADAAINSIQFGHGDTEFVTASTDQTARIWSAQQGKAQLRSTIRHEQNVLFAQFLAKGLLTVTESAAQTWDVRRGAAWPFQAPPTWLPFGELAFHGFSRDGKRIAAIVNVSGKKVACVLDLSSGRLSGLFGRVDRPLNAIEISPDGNLVVTAVGKSVLLWDAKTSQQTRQFPHPEEVLSVVFSRDGRRLLTRCSNSVKVWEVVGSRVAFNIGGVFGSAQISHDGQRVMLVSGTTPRKAQLRSSRDGSMLSELTKLPDGQVKFSPNGEFVAVKVLDTCVVWDATTGRRLVNEFRQQRNLTDIEFSPDTKCLVTASEDGTARIWEVRSGKPVTEPLRHAGPVDRARFNHDGTQIITVSTGSTGSTRVWDAQTGQVLTEHLQYLVRISSSVDFSPTGDRIASRYSVQDLPFGPLPVPPWLPELAEAVAGKRVDDSGALIGVGPERLVSVRGRINDSSENDFYTRWARWFLADRATRVSSPFSSVTWDELMRNLRPALEGAKQLAKETPPPSHRVEEKELPPPSRLPPSGQVKQTTRPGPPENLRVVSE